MCLTLKKCLSILLLGSLPDLDPDVVITSAQPQKHWRRRSPIPEGVDVIQISDDSCDEDR